MALQFLGGEDCKSNSCPTVWDDGDSYVIQGFTITDPVALTTIGRLPAGEAVVRLPKTMMRFFPECQHGQPTY